MSDVGEDTNTAAGAVLVTVAQVHGLLRRFQDLPGIGQLFLFAFQPVDFAVLQRELFKLLDLVGQQLATGGLLVPGRSQFVQFVASPQPVRGQLFELPGGTALAREIVEQASLGFLAEQGLVRVLAVDIDQQLAQLGAVLQGCCLAQFFG